MKKSLANYYFLMIAVFIGFFLTIQLKANITPYEGIITIPKILEMKNDIENIKGENQNLAESINEAKKKLQTYEEGMQNSGNLLESMQKELYTAKVNADYEKMGGPGLIITLKDSTAEVIEEGNIDWYVIHDQDILEIVNELRAAGAEAISINDERVTATTNIRCGGPTINIDGKRHAVPFVIKAIGDPVKLEATANSPAGYIEYMRFYGIGVDIQKVENLVVNAYDGKYKLNFQKMTKDGE